MADAARTAPAFTLEYDIQPQHVREALAKLAQVVIKKPLEFQGRTCDQVEAGGIRAISANGTELFYPWATVDQVRETARAFHLVDRSPGQRIKGR